MDLEVPVRFNDIMKITYATNTLIPPGGTNAYLGEILHFNSDAKLITVNTVIFSCTSDCSFELLLDNNVILKMYSNAYSSLNLDLGFSVEQYQRLSFRVNNLSHRVHADCDISLIYAERDLQREFEQHIDDGLSSVLNHE